MIKKDPPWIQTVSLAPPSLQDNTADADRVLNALKSGLNSEAIHLDLELLRQLPEILRSWKYNVRCVLFKARHQWELIGLTSPNDATGITGLAVDLGTTRVVSRLIDLVDGQVIAESAFDNPQESVGPDILARIHFADQNGGLNKLNELIIDGISHLVVVSADQSATKAALTISQADLDSLVRSKAAMYTILRTINASPIWS
jgi:uncharacterized 2Fe-2S/4Fe-4S cluster protein (DUF4445 family)